jgi:hypothetical protein
VPGGKASKSFQTVLALLHVIAILYFCNYSITYNMKGAFLRNILCDFKDLV